jgi:uncharacterized protein YciI
MFIVLLKFSDQRSRAAEWMQAHQAWLQKGFDEGVFLASGSLAEKQGGCILAQGADLNGLQHRLADDPFVAHGVVRAEVIEAGISKAHPALAGLLGIGA